ncbi:glycosidase [uncultured Winogradskyella sp.]|uniref:glycosidase n=1 Tax=uncultured Winogradskyella sp. TaxID=395353 RepID=UPI00261A0F4B|nr:glycosidase [uncultured Winogradskyella sp.]
MGKDNKNEEPQFKGVMFNAYPDSIGEKLSDAINMFQLPELKDTFSLFYVLPTFFNSDLDRGFSIIDYNLNDKLVSEDDLIALEKLGISLKFDIVLNHLSVASPQFRDLLKYGEASKYKDFFINWNAFWEDYGNKNDEGTIIPNEVYLNKLFMRKSGLPILKVVFPDGSERPYWNTFYQKITYNPITKQDLVGIKKLAAKDAVTICNLVNKAIDKLENLDALHLGDLNSFKPLVIKILKQKRSYLGQMDVNAKSQLVWDFYEETLAKLKDFGCKILRLDAFAYLHKEVGESNFFNVPGTWNYLDRIKTIADKNGLTLLPEIHAEYGAYLHDEVAEKGFQIYDFFLPGLMIHTIEKKSSTAILKWAKEIIDKGYNVVNMLGCHDGIPVLDLKGKEVNGFYNKGLLADKEIEAIMETIIDRGGRVKNLYGPSGKKISYYQVNATFFSALGEDPKKMLLARAIQLFMPGVPQIWYLDIFEGKNNYDAVEKAGEGGHKEINRTTLTTLEIKESLKKDTVLKQLEIIRLRNTHNAFGGDIIIKESKPSGIDILWENGEDFANLKVDLNMSTFAINYSNLS